MDEISNDISNPSQDIPLFWRKIAHLSWAFPLCFLWCIWLVSSLTHDDSIYLHIIIAGIIISIVLGLAGLYTGIKFWDRGILLPSLAGCSVNALMVLLYVLAFIFYIAASELKTQDQRIWLSSKIRNEIQKRGIKHLENMDINEYTQDLPKVNKGLCLRNKQGQLVDTSGNPFCLKREGNKIILTNKNGCSEVVLVEEYDELNKK